MKLRFIKRDGKHILQYFTEKYDVTIDTNKSPSDMIVSIIEGGEWKDVPLCDEDTGKEQEQPE